MKVTLLFRVLGITIIILFSLFDTLAAESIQPDRPGFSTGTYTVEPGLAHLEFGFQSDYSNNASDADGFTTPLLNFRVGLTSSTELNILWDGWSRERMGGASSTSSSDMMIGVKHRLITEEKYNVSLLSFISLPTGSTEDSGSFSPFLGLLWDYEINSNISAFGTLQFTSFVEDGTRSTNFQPAIGLSFSHTEKLSTYIEYYRDMSLNLSTTDIDMFDAGIAYLLTKDIQIDVNLGVSIDGDSSDFIGAGLAIRF